MTGASRQVLSALEALGVPYETIPIDPAHAETAVFCERYGYPLDRSCNTIIVASKKPPGKFAACVVTADRQLDVNRRVRKLLGVSKASFATASDMAALTGMEVGGVTPFALPEGLPLLVDERILGLEWIILGGGGRDMKIRVSPEVLERLGARIVPDLALRRDEDPGPAAD